jgi:hypothetical protein
VGGHRIDCKRAGSPRGRTATPSAAVLLG